MIRNRKWPLSVYEKQAGVKGRILVVSNASGIKRCFGTETLAGDALVSIIK